MREASARMAPPASADTSGRAKGKSSRARTTPITFSTLLIGALAFVPPLLLGGAFPETLAVIGLLAAAAAIAVSRQPGARVSWAPVTVVLFALAAWTIVQALPLPEELVAFVSPVAHEEWARAADAIGAPLPQWMTLSIDPGQTIGHVATWCAIACAFLAGSAAAAIGQRRNVAKVVGLSGVLIAVIGVAHEAVNAEKLFGLYRPQFVPPALLAPIINDNNLAGFFVMATPLLIALGIEGAVETRKAWFAAAGFVAFATIMTLSRGGMLALLIATSALLMALLLRRRRSSTATPRGSIIAVLAVLSTLVVGGLAAVSFLGRSVDAELTADTAGKLELLERGLAFAADAPAVGVGRGAFASVFTRYLGSASRAEYAENLPVQWITEWGLLPALSALGVIAFAVLRVFRSARTLTQRAGLIAVGAVVLQNLGDFGLELPGIAVVAALLLGASLAPSGSDSHAEAVASAASRNSSSMRVALVAAATIAVVAGAIAPLTSVDRHRRELAALADASRFDAATVANAVWFHPADAAVFVLGGGAARRAGDLSAAHFLNRAMSLAPDWTSPHAEAALLLYGLGYRGQAMIEVRQIAMRAPSAAIAIACQLADADASPGMLLRSAPYGSDRSGYVQQLAQQCLRDEPLAARELFEQALADVPTDTSTRVVLAEMLLWSDPAAAWGHAEAAIGAERTPRAIGVGARALLSLQRPREARELLAEARCGHDDCGPLALVRAEAAAALGDVEAMREGVEAARAAAAGDVARLASIDFELGRLEERLGNRANALRAFDSSNRLVWSAPALARVAALAEGFGDVRRAYRARSELCRAQVGPEHCEAARRLEAGSVR